MAYAQTWDETVPAGSRDLALGNDDIIAFKIAMRERIQTDHYFPSTHDEAAGEHTKLTLRVQGSAPTAAADKGFLYSFDVSAKAELHYRDEDNNTIQLTTAGKINSNKLSALTADLDFGSFEIRSQTFESDVATGTAPLVVASTTVVTNLNADLLDGQSGAYYLALVNATGTASEAQGGTGATTIVGAKIAKSTQIAYTGNGADGRSITGAGFQPNLCIVQIVSSGGVVNEAYIRTLSFSGDSSKQMSNAEGPTADEIQAFESDGIQVGTNAGVNQNTKNFDALCFKTAT